MFWDSFWRTLTVVLYIANIILVAYTCVSLFLKRQDPIKTISWMIVLILLPYLGLILYIFFGRNFRKEKMFNRKGASDQQIKEKIAYGMLQRMHDENILPPELQKHSKLIIQNLRSNNSLLTTDSEAEIYFDGKSSLLAMLKSIEEAQEHIHLQSFIIEDDEVGNLFKDALIAKAKKGIEVRVMYDGFGGRKLSHSYINELKEAGVEVLVFSPFRWFFPPVLVNYRNHRKILVVDGKVGFLGGVNIANRYFNGGVFPEWRDTHIKLIGQSVYLLQASFLLDRYFILNHNLKKRNKYYPEFEIEPMKEKVEKHFYSQIISSGPDSDWSDIMQCYFTAITNAKRDIYIITPYFIPTDPILNAIKITALSNVNVNLMIPERSDTWLTNWGTMSYISELLDAGVNIYLFKKGFNHSKVLSIDGEYCIIGSANMDTRSLEHHFEVTSILYDSNCAKTIEDKFHSDMHRCTKLNKKKWKKRRKIFRLYESVARLLSPLL